MNVIFQTKSKNQNRFSLGNVEGYGNVVFNRGVFMTSDKDLIKRLISHPIRKRGDYIMVTNDILVADYLDGKESDKISEELLKEVTLQGILELGKVYACVETQPTLIKIELVGKPISDAAQKVFDFYKVSKEVVKAQNDTYKEDLVIPENLKSTDLGVLEAVAYIENHSFEDLATFVAHDETRKTVLKAWDKKQV